MISALYFILLFIDTIQMSPIPHLSHPHQAPTLSLPLAITTLLSMSVGYVYMFFWLMKNISKLYTYTEK